MNVIDLLTAELRSRNVAKYYPAGEDVDKHPTPNALLVSYVAEGLEKLASMKPFIVKEQIDVTESTMLVPLAVVLKPTKIYLDGEELKVAKNFPVYKGDRIVQMYEEVGILPLGTYSTELETQMFGDWTFDLVRKMLVFASNVFGHLEVYGYGIPAEANLEAGDRRAVADYALSTALDKIVPELLTKTQIILPGLTIPAPNVEGYVKEAEVLMAKFKKHANVAYFSVAQ
jgi:hypothetical protein